jgi:SHS2 domain-containing protein
LGYREIPHTADLAIEIEEKTMEGVFSQAAEALFDMLVGIENVSPVKKIGLSVAAPDREALLVAWLNELLFYYEAREYVFSRFEFVTLRDTSLVANCFGEERASRHRPKREIKAATFNELSISEKGGVWRAHIVFDL